MPSLEETDPWPLPATLTVRTGLSARLIVVEVLAFIVSAQLLLAAAQPGRPQLET